MSADAPLAGTGFRLVAAPGRSPFRDSHRLGVSRRSEEELVLVLELEHPSGRLATLATIHLPTATIEPGGGESDVGVEVLNGRGETTRVLPGAPPIELEPGDTVRVGDAALALRYAPWADEKPGGFRSWLRADAAEAAHVREGFTRFCESSGVPAPVTHDLALAMQETLDNVIEHAYRGWPRGVTLVEASVDPDSWIVVTVRDRAPAFDPADVPPPDPAATLETRSEGGLGLHLVRNLVDTLRHERRSGENRLLLARRFAGS